MFSSTTSMSSTAQDVRTTYLDTIGGILWVCLHTHIVRLNQKDWKVVDTVVGPRVNSLVYVKVNDTVWGCSSDSTIYVYARTSGIPLRRFFSSQVNPSPLENVVDVLVEEGHKQHIFVLATYGKYVWSGGFDKIVRIWDAQALTLVNTLTPEHDVINAMVVMPIKANLVGNYAITPVDGNHTDKEALNSFGTFRQDSPEQLQVQVWKVWSGAWDGTLAVWV